jgi:DNA repair protein RadC
MRQRYLETGLAGFADHECLELLLFYAIPRRDTNPLAHELMERYGSLEAVLNAPVEDLLKVKGMGESGALLLGLVLKLAERSRLQKDQPIILNATEKAGAYLLRRFAGEKYELVYELCLDRKGKLLSCKLLTQGDVNGAELNIRKLVGNALLANASAVILSHNHPSGVALPSGEDLATTHRVWTALDSVGIELVDHIIVADEDFVSLRDSGYFAT